MGLPRRAGIAKNVYTKEGITEMEEGQIKNKLMKVIGIDASLTGTGICTMLIDWPTGEVVSYKTEHLKNTLIGPERLAYIRDKVKRAIELTDQFDALYFDKTITILDPAAMVLIEDYAYSKGDHAHQIGELGGVLRLMFYENNYRWKAINPSHVKQFVTGKGNASKEDMAVDIYALWGQRFGSNDEADSYALAQMARAMVCGEDKIKGLKAIQKKVISVIKSGVTSKPKKSKKKGATQT
jgi:Holliday junction resolvasome RuvABC endonuclease subunit